MALHLGRLRVVTRRKEGKCIYKLCEKEHLISPGDQVVVRTKAGNINGQPTIFYTMFHPECFGPWLIYRCSQIPPSALGRKIMDLSPEDKTTRALQIRTRARLLRSLRKTNSGDKLTVLVDRISGLDEEIKETGYPVLYYQGRRSVSVIVLEKFIADIKNRYPNPRSVPVDEWHEAEQLGIEMGFNKAMVEWSKETTAATIAKQKPDIESSEEDQEE